MTDTMKSSGDENVVVDYLKDHPDFFDRHLDLLTLLKVPHPSGDAISLVERQLDLLRQQNRLLENNLRELVDIARDNQRVTSHLHTLARELVEAKTLSDTVNATEQVLQNDFGISCALVHFFENAVPDAQRLINENHRITYFSSFLVEGRPICGDLTDGQMKRLFGERRLQIKSAAMVPVKYIDDLGILVLGSDDPERFVSGMGVYFLEQLGALVGSSVAKHLE